MDLDSALASLPDVSRVVVWLHDVEGFTHKEIASQLGKTESFSKSQLSRAYRKLRPLLARGLEIWDLERFMEIAAAGLELSDAHRRAFLDGLRPNFQLGDQICRAPFLQRPRRRWRQRPRTPATQEARSRRGEWAPGSAPC